MSLHHPPTHPFIAHISEAVFDPFRQPMPELHLPPFPTTEWKQPAQLLYFQSIDV